MLHPQTHATPSISVEPASSTSTGFISWVDELSGDHDSFDLMEVSDSAEESESEFDTTSRKLDFTTKNKFGSRAGAKQKPIWDHFVTKRNGKKIIFNKCKYCQSAVSAQPQRMSLHISKCVKAKVNPRTTSSTQPEIMLATTTSMQNISGQHFLQRSNHQQKMTSFVKQLSRNEKV